MGEVALHRFLTDVDQAVRPVARGMADVNLGDSKGSIVNGEGIDNCQIIAENNRTKFCLPDNTEKTSTSTYCIIDDNGLVTFAIEIPYKS